MCRSRSLLWLCVIVLATSIASCNKERSIQPASTSTPSPSQYRIGVLYIEPHENVTRVVDGLKSGLAKRGIKASIVERHVSGDRNQLSATAIGLINSKVDVLVPITTPATQAALSQASGRVPLCFLAVTDPVGAGVVKSLEHPDTCTGVSDLAPLEATLELIRQLSPNVKTLGLPFSPDDQPAVFGKNLAASVAPKYALVLTATPITNRDELPIQVRQLLQRNDSLLIGPDNAMFEAAPQIVRLARDARKPVYAADSTSIKAGAVGGYTIDYTAVGDAGADLIARILKGSAPGTLPVTVMRSGILELNTSAAAASGVQLPTNVAQAAKVTYQ